MQGVVSTFFSSGAVWLVGVVSPRTILFLVRIGQRPNILFSTMIATQTHRKPSLLLQICAAINRSASIPEARDYTLLKKRCVLELQTAQPHPIIPLVWGKIAAEDDPEFPIISGCFEDREFRAHLVREYILSWLIVDCLPCKSAVVDRNFGYVLGKTLFPKFSIPVTEVLQQLAAVDTVQSAVNECITQENTTTLAVLSNHVLQRAYGSSGLPRNCICALRMAIEASFIPQEPLNRVPKSELSVKMHAEHHLEDETSSTIVPTTSADDFEHNEEEEGKCCAYHHRKRMARLAAAARPAPDEMLNGQDFTPNLEELEVS